MAVFTSRAHPTRELTVTGTVPTGLTAVSTVDTFLEQMFIANTTGSPITILITNTAGTAFIPTVSVPANGVSEVNWPSLLKFTAGVKWQAGGVGLVGELFGYIVGS